MGMGILPGSKFAATVKIGEKGQIVIPKEIRDMFGLVPGDTLLVLADRKRGMAIPPKAKFAAASEAVFGAVMDGEEEDQ